MAGCMEYKFYKLEPGEPNNWSLLEEPDTQIIRFVVFGLNTWNNLDDNSTNGSCYSNGTYNGNRPLNL